jgi:alpha-glucosidase
MPWEAQAPCLGFSSGEPWLPAGEDHRQLAVDRQQAREDSLLNFTRDCLKLRDRLPALRHGSMRVVEAGEQLLVFERVLGSQRLRCSFNLSDAPVGWDSAGNALAETGERRSGSLGAWSAVIEEMAG